MLHPPEPSAAAACPTAPQGSSSHCAASRALRRRRMRGGAATSRAPSASFGAAPARAPVLPPAPPPPHCTLKASPTASRLSCGRQGRHCAASKGQGKEGGLTCRSHFCASWNESWPSSSHAAPVSLVSPFPLASTCTLSCVCHSPPEWHTQARRQCHQRQTQRGRWS